MVLDATQHHDRLLSAERLRGWHAALLPTGYSGVRKITIAHLALAQMEGPGRRFYSVSAQIRRERSRYYRTLETTQRGTLDITEWLAWFVACFGSAIGEAETEHGDVLAKAAFWRRHAHEPCSARQKAVLDRVMHRFVGS